MIQTQDYSNRQACPALRRSKMGHYIIKKESKWYRYWVKCQDRIFYIYAADKDGYFAKKGIRIEDEDYKTYKDAVIAMDEKIKHDNNFNTKQELVFYWIRNLFLPEGYKGVKDE